ncbi:hypothetical protein JL720_10493 [Aureococcus anophagefferens]|nr:hypothetical protein JL720_10493 [Aureococcus anophagefferens]
MGSLIVLLLALAGADASQQWRVSGGDGPQETVRVDGLEAALAAAAAARAETIVAVAPSASGDAYAASGAAAAVDRFLTTRLEYALAREPFDGAAPGRFAVFGSAAASLCDKSTPLFARCPPHSSLCGDPPAPRVRQRDALDLREAEPDERWDSERRLTLLHRALWDRPAWRLRNATAAEERAFYDRAVVPRRRRCAFVHIRHGDKLYDRWLRIHKTRSFAVDLPHVSEALPLRAPGLEAATSQEASTAAATNAKLGRTCAQPATPEAVRKEYGTGRRTCDPPSPPVPGPTFWSDAAEAFFRPLEARAREQEAGG